jgi:hypothetical protein
VYVNPFVWEKQQLMKDTGSHRKLSKRLGFSYEGAVQQFVSGYRPVNAQLILGLQELGVAGRVTFIPPNLKKREEYLKNSDALFYAVHPKPKNSKKLKEKE